MRGPGRTSRQCPRRGTVRLALKSAGLQVESLDPREMKAVLTKILPEELARRAVADAEGLCNKLAERLARGKADAIAPGRPDAPGPPCSRRGSTTCSMRPRSRDARRSLR